MSGVLYYYYHVEHEISDLFSVELAIPHKRSSRKSEWFCCDGDGENETNEAKESLCNSPPFILYSFAFYSIFPLQQFYWTWADLRLTPSARPDFCIGGAHPKKTIVRYIK